MKYSINEYVHHFINEHVQSGDLCIDATAGNGNDTLYLCQLVGEAGEVTAFDIQKAAVETVRERLKQEGMDKIATVHLESHCNMALYAEENTISCIIFNFGYLPGGDHRISTNGYTSIQAIKTGLPLLKKDGLMSLCIYSGGDSGFEEKEMILQFLKQLNQQEYLVIVNEFYNRSNNPPIPVQIIKCR